MNLKAFILILFASCVSLLGSGRGDDLLTTSVDELFSRVVYDFPVTNIITGKETMSINWYDKVEIAEQLAELGGAGISLGASLCERCLERRLPNLNYISFAVPFAKFGPDYYARAEEICENHELYGVHLPYDHVVSARGYHALGNDCYKRGDREKGRAYYEKAAEHCGKCAKKWYPGSEDVTTVLASKVLEDMSKDCQKYQEEDLVQKYNDEARRITRLDSRFSDRY